VPAHITGLHHQSGTDRIAELASNPRFGRFGTILNVQGDEPFISRNAAQGALQVVLSGTAPIGTAAAKAPIEVLARPDVVKVVTTDSGRALYFSRAPIPFLREEAEARLLESTVRQHIGVYAYTREALLEWVALPMHPLEQVERLEQLRPLAHGLHIGVATVETALESGIDTEEDLARASARYEARGISAVNA